MSELDVVMLPEVAAALREGKAVVALESTIISHGMPFPQNFQTAQEVEAVVREEGAVPATIAILDGKICVGLDASQLERLARLGHAVSKTSRRDVAAVVARGGNGATTVSGTMVIANMVGIPVFVTGGIGGVHRGGADTMDVSADLTELGRTPVAVVCAGAKSILDIGLTLEYLETQGVPVVGYRTEEFPAFFTAHSGHRVSTSVASPAECAALLQAQFTPHLNTGVVLAVPIPEQYAAEGGLIEKATQRALAEMTEQGIGGNLVTPFLLKRVNELTEGQSLASNIRLVKNNASVGSRVAVELARLRRESTDAIRVPHSLHPQPVFLGAAVWDSIATPTPSITTSVLPPPAMLGTSTPGRVAGAPGGVARNIARVVAGLGFKNALVSAVGEDAAGQAITTSCTSVGITPIFKRVHGGRSGVFHATLTRSGDLLAAVADMGVFDALVPESVHQVSSLIRSAPIACVDTNPPAPTIHTFLSVARHAGVPTVVNPVSLAKSEKVCRAETLSLIDILTPNAIEVVHMANILQAQTGTTRGEEEPSDAAVAEAARALCDAGVRYVVVTRGARGVWVASQSPSYETAVPAIPVARVVDTTGAGDALTAGIIAGMLARRGSDTVCDLSKEAVMAAVRVGLQAAALAVSCEGSTPHEVALQSLAKDIGVLSIASKL